MSKKVSTKQKQLNEEGWEFHHVVRFTYEKISRMELRYLIVTENHQSQQKW